MKLRGKLLVKLEKRIALSKAKRVALNEAIEKRSWPSKRSFE